ncbi:MAG: helix-turn-helix domain-containing protein [Cyanobacteria bacterium J06638_20]
MTMRIASRKPTNGQKIKLVVEDTGKVTGMGKTTRLTFQEARMLIHMADRSPRTCTPEQIMVAVKPPSKEDDLINIEQAKVLVSKTRQKLRKITDMEIIETVRGLGYRIPNYIEVMTNIKGGETLRIQSDIFAMLVSLSFEAKEPLEDVVREVLMIGGREKKLRVLRKIAEEEKHMDDFQEEDAWE